MVSRTDLRPPCCFGRLHLRDLRSGLLEDGLQFGLLGRLQPQRQVLFDETVAAADVSRTRGTR